MTISKVEQEGLEVLASLTDRDRIPFMVTSKTRGIISDKFLTTGRDSRLGQESKESLPEPLPKPTKANEQSTKN